MEKESEQAMSEWETKAQDCVSMVNAEYADETFVSEGYGYFDDIVSAMARLARSAYAQGLEDAAKLCDQDAEAYRELQARASESRNLAMAGFHLSEKQAAFRLAREIRMLKPDERRKDA